MTQADGRLSGKHLFFDHLLTKHKEKDMDGYLIELALDEARGWVDEAIAFFRATGKEIALVEFSNPQGRFVRGEQYIYVLDINGVMLAHPVNERYVRKDFYRIQDSDGKSFIKEIVDTANARGFGWVEYKWFDPATRREQPKTVYFEKVNGLIFCSGVYRENPVLALPEFEPDEAADHGTPAEGAVAPGDVTIDMGMKKRVEEDVIELVPDDARRWVKKAISFYRANGKGIALAEFASTHARFFQDGRYIYVLDFNGVMLAHPVNENYAGKDFYRIQDADGKLFIKEIVDTANNGGSGWAQYRWFNPTTKREQVKTVYFEKVDNLIFCSGIYEL
jgi:cytochrome c